MPFCRLPNGKSEQRGELSGVTRGDLPRGRGCVSTGDRLVTCGQETRSSEFRKGRGGARFQTCYLEASAHQTGNGEKGGEQRPRRLVAGGFADADETCFGKRLRMPGIFLE